MSDKLSLQKLITASLLAALVCVVTMTVKVPSPLNGYLNLGDCIILLSGWLLPPVYGFLAAGVGSALADLSGYALYAPATLIIKGAMAVIFFFCFKLMKKKLGSFVSMIIGGVLAEVFMILGYYVFEGFLYGFAPSAVNIPANGVQGCAGLVLGLILIKMLEKTKIISNSNIRSKLS
ncbi:MAG: ECF transporter S component [Clostridia bacterium]|nr:ECF transporter S component [Clostridia bacterium]